MFNETNLRNSHRGVLIIAIAFIAALVIYALVAEFFLKDLEIGLTTYGTFRYIVMGIAAVVVVMIVVLKNLFLSGKIKIPTGASYQEFDIKEDSVEAREQEFINRLRVSHIITYALCESIAIFGLLLYLMGKDKTMLYAFLGISFFLMMVNFPKYADWKSRLEDYLGEA